MGALSERLRLSRFFSGEKPVDTPITLNHRRIFILPTHRGLNFVMLTALLLLIAFVYNNNLVYMLGFLLASVFFVTILHTFKVLAGLVVQPGQSPPVFAGDLAGYAIHLSNPLNVPRDGLHISLEDSQNVVLAAYSQTSVTLHAATHKRGWHTAGTVTVFSTYPLGLFRAWSPLRFHLKTLVYPKPATPCLPFPESAAGGQVRQGVSVKGADDFYGLQSYQPGDPIKHIYWKAFAKNQQVFSKQYGGVASEHLWLTYEDTPGHTVEERLSQLCRWVLDAERADLAFGLVLPGLRLAPERGVAHTKKCLEALALF